MVLSDFLSKFLCVFLLHFQMTDALFRTSFFTTVGSVFGRAGAGSGVEGKRGRFLILTHHYRRQTQRPRQRLFCFNCPFFTNIFAVLYILLPHKQIRLPRYPYVLSLAEPMLPALFPLHAPTTIHRC